MQPANLFKYCPHCGKPRNEGRPHQPFACEFCGFQYYFNPCLAVAAILLGPDGRALFIRRAKDPAKGKLAVPGGFVDIGETAEQALRREIREEVNLEVGSLEFLCSALNEYLYRSVNYPVVDLFFVCRAVAVEQVAALDGVESFAWLKPTEVDYGQIAFPSVGEALRLYAAGGSARQGSTSSAAAGSARRL
jgi:ADP-ribose pyrophosphatase YjhB (NUDIX family)